MSRKRKTNTHLPPCVYPHHGAYYLVKRNVWTRLGEDLSSALAAYARIHEAPAGGMAELIDEALTHLKPKIATSTYAQYVVAGAKLKKSFIEFTPRSVKMSDVARFKYGYAHIPNMCNRCLSLLRQVFTYALERQLVDTNPVVGVKPHTEKKRERLILQSEYDAIYAHAGERLQIIMELLRYGMQRVTDTLRIPESDILPEGIRFRQQKTKAYLTIAWVPPLRDAVARARALHGNVRTLTLLRGRGRKVPDYRTVREQWDVACKAARVGDAHLHDLRAMGATQADEEGKDAGAGLGHTSAANTKRYLRGRKAKLVQGPEFISRQIASITKKP